MNKLLASLALAASTTLASAVAFAENPPPPPAATATPDAQPQAQPQAQATPIQLRPSKPLELAPASNGMSTTSKLGLLVLALGGGAWLYNKKKNGKAAPAAITEIQIRGRKQIGVRSELLVVEVASQKLLIGVTAGSMSRLAILSDVGLADPAEEQKVRALQLRDEDESSEDEDARDSDVVPMIKASSAAAMLDRAPSKARRRGRPEGAAVEEQIRGLLRNTARRS